MSCYRSFRVDRFPENSCQNTENWSEPKRCDAWLKLECLSQFARDYGQPVRPYLARKLLGLSKSQFDNLVEAGVITKRILNGRTVFSERELRKHSQYFWHSPEGLLGLPVDTVSQDYPSTCGHVIVSTSKRINKIIRPRKVAA